MYSAPTLEQRLARLRGATIEFDLRPHQSLVHQINEIEGEIQPCSDADLELRSSHIRAEARAGADLEALLPGAYALVRETARRVLGLRPYDVQMVASIALHQGKVVEMQTGEGKTLAAVAPAYLNALSGRGVHVLTFNDYLARRDAEWMEPVYKALGLTVGWVAEGRSPAQRRAAYGADITYVTAKEAGFDLLRDGLAIAEADLVHRPFHYAIVDEADSLLIDEARVPLVLAGGIHDEVSSVRDLASMVARLEPDVDFVIEEHGRNVELLERGFDAVESHLGCGNLLVEENFDLLAEVNCALHAFALLKRDVDYIVRQGRIELVDEFTGRVADDRHWPDGLQAALEAKEGLERRQDGRILGSISLQQLFRRYSRLCGMTGTARDAARELQDVYDLSVVVLPTHRPMIRRDHADVLFTHQQAMEGAVVKEIERAHASGRPVLVGTLSVRESERLAERLTRETGIACRVLNARNDEMEAKIIAEAGALGAVTISTNMAGRGTDIRLGGEDESERQRVVELGGLYIIGTHRSESQRVDRQLRGRAGRQGDPGESRFFVSLEDDLLVQYGIRSLIPRSWVPENSAAPIDHALIRREVGRAQRIVEGQNFEIRKTLLRYSKPVEEQFDLFQEKRRAVMEERGPGLWQGQPRHAELLNLMGEPAMRRAERLVTLTHFDRAWSDHLAQVANLREGIHLVGLGGDDPLTVFLLRSAEAFRDLWRAIDASVLAALDQVAVKNKALDLESLGIQGPSSTWTYIVHDDPFRHQLGRMLTGQGGATMAVGAALMAGPLFILWLLVERFFRRRGSQTAES